MRSEFIHLFNTRVCNNNSWGGGSQGSITHNPQLIGVSSCCSKPDTGIGFPSETDEASVDIAACRQIAVDHCRGMGQLICFDFIDVDKADQVVQAVSRTPKWSELE